MIKQIPFIKNILEVCMRETSMHGNFVSCKIVRVQAVFQRRGTQVNLFSVGCKNDISVCTTFCDIALPNLVHRTVFAYLYLSMLRLRLMQHDIGCFICVFVLYLDASFVKISFVHIKEPAISNILFCHVSY